MQLIKSSTETLSYLKNRFKMVCILLLALGFFSATAQIQTQNVDGELEARNLKWQLASPQEFEPLESKAFKQWAKYWEPDRQHFFSKIDITGDGKPEYIVTNSDFPSGGHAFLIIEKKGTTWTNIAAFQGGLVLSSHDVPKGFAIHAYGKVGKHIFQEFKYNGFRFALTHEHTIPDILVDNYFYARWQQLNLFENLQIHKK